MIAKLGILDKGNFDQRMHRPRKSEEKAGKNL
jgi:hypothetical protein